MLGPVLFGAALDAQLKGTSAWRHPEHAARSSAPRFEALYDRGDGIPVPGNDRHAEESIHRAEVPYGRHLASVEAEEKSAFSGENSHKPSSVPGKIEGKAGRPPRPSGQNTHETNDVGGYRRFPERMNGSRAAKLAATADDDVGLEWQSALEFHPKLALADGPSNYEGPRGTNVDDVVAFQLPCEQGWPDRPVSADVDASQENDECHGSPWAMGNCPSRDIKRQHAIPRDLKYRHGPHRSG